MQIGISTRWNSYRHSSGGELVDELRGLGFHTIELGYDLRAELVSGIREAVEQGEISVVSVHNFCPVPPAVPCGHPEVFSLCALDERERESAIKHTSNTIRFAAELKAAVVIAHAGRVRLARMTERLILLYERGQRFQTRYEKYKLNLMARRDRKVGPYLEKLRDSLSRLLPVLDECGVVLALENLPTWEAIPTELELEQLINEMGTDRIRYWHDIGHAQVRENLGFISHMRWLERLSPFVAGMHIHDVIAPAYDHLPPPQGEIPFEQFKNIAIRIPRLIMEPAPTASAEAVVKARDYLLQLYSPAGGQNGSKRKGKRGNEKSPDNRDNRTGRILPG